MTKDLGTWVISKELTEKSIYTSEEYYNIAIIIIVGALYLPNIYQYSLPSSHLFLIFSSYYDDNLFRKIEGL